MTHIRIHSFATSDSIIWQHARNSITQTYEYILLQHATALFVCVASHVLHDTHTNTFVCNTQQNYSHVLQVMSYMKHIRIHYFATRDSILWQHARALLVCVAGHVIHDTHTNTFFCNTRQHYSYVWQVMSYMTHI